MFKEFKFNTSASFLKAISVDIAVEWTKGDAFVFTGSFPSLVGLGSLVMTDDMRFLGYVVNRSSSGFSVEWPVEIDSGSADSCMKATELTVLEVGFGRFYMVEEKETFKLINRKLEQERLGLRFHADFDSEYIRTKRGDDVAVLFDKLHEGETYMLLEDIPSMNAMKVINDNDELGVNVDRFLMKPELDFRLRSVDDFSAIPNWYRISK